MNRVLYSRLTSQKFRLPGFPRASNTPGTLVFKRRASLCAASTTSPQSQRENTIENNFSAFSNAGANYEDALCPKGWLQNAARTSEEQATAPALGTP